MVFFLDILTAPLDKQEERITGSSKGVIPIAIATEKVKATSKSCFQALTINVSGIINNINLVNNLLIFSIPFWNSVFGFPDVIVCATLPK
ncbi:unknown [Clostridium sp. CAG:354]|nr:unknown [Clostridium sp. CAG:354]